MKKLQPLCTSLEFNAHPNYLKANSANVFFLFLIRKMTFSSKSLYFSNDSSWRAFRTFSPRAPDKYFYVVYVWAKGVNYIYIFFKKKNVFRRKRIREVGVLVDKLSWLRKPVRLTNLDLPMQVVRNIWKSILTLFKVVIFWNRCLNNENNTLRS